VLERIRRNPEAVGVGLVEAGSAIEVAWDADACRLLPRERSA
jgi:hypothetical protein